MIRSILITGGTGYIGRNLCLAVLEAGYSVHTIFRNSRSLSWLPSDKIKIHYYDGSFGSILKIFQENSIDCVIHLAAVFDQPACNVDEMIDCNVKLGAYMLEILSKQNHGYFINTGTYWQYGDADNKILPITLYAATKNAFLDIMKHYYLSVKCLTLILGDVYGPNDNRNKIFNSLYSSYKKNERFKCTYGEQKLPIININDIIQGYITAIKYILEIQGHKIYSLFPIEPISLKEIIKTYITITGFQINILWGQYNYRIGQIMTPVYIPSLPNWIPRVTLSEGIRQVAGKYE